MGIITVLGQALSVLGRLLGLAPGSRINTSVLSAEAEDPAPAPLVAVLGWRYRHDPFLLARRIASIAKLNTPIGRKPRGARSRFQGLPPVPKARMGAKRGRLNANQGPRVLTRSSPPGSGARIIPFPTATARAKHRSPQTQLAA